MKFKNHPIILLKPLLAIMGFLAWLTFSIIEEIVEGDLSLIELWTDLGKYLTRDMIDYILDHKIPSLMFAGMLVVIMLFLLRSFFEWKNSSISLGQNTLFYTRQGLLGKVHREVNFSNIANVNIRSGIIYGILGLSVLTIDIDSSATAKELDYKIYLSKKNAQIFKNWVLDPNKRIEVSSEKNESLAIEIEGPSDKENTLVESDLNGDKKVNLRPKYRGNQQDLATYTFMSKDAIRHFFLDISVFNIVLFVAAIIALITKVLALFAIANLGMIKTFSSKIDALYQFKVKRYPDHIHIEYGLFNLKDFTIPIENISSVACHKSIIARIFGYKCLTLDAIGYGNEVNENRLLSLYMKNDSINTFMERVIPEFTLDEDESDYILKPVSILKYYGPLFTISFLLIFVVIGLPLGKYWTGLIGLPLGLVASLYKYLGRKIRLTDKDLIIKKGLFSSQTLIIPINQIDMLTINQNPVYKKLGLYSLTVYKRDPKTGKTVVDTGPYPVGIFDQLVDYYINGEIFSQ